MIVFQIIFIRDSIIFRRTKGDCLEASYTAFTFGFYSKDSFTCSVVLLTQPREFVKYRKRQKQQSKGWSNRVRPLSVTQTAPVFPRCYFRKRTKLRNGLNPNKSHWKPHKMEFHSKSLIFWGWKVWPNLLLGQFAYSIKFSSFCKWA